MISQTVSGAEFLTWLLTSARVYADESEQALRDVVLEVCGQPTEKVTWSIRELEVWIHTYRLDREVYLRVLSGTVVDRNGKVRSLSRLVSQFVRRLREQQAKLSSLRADGEGGAGAEGD